jgi:polymorphic toxin system nucleotidyltransferase-like protein
MNPESLPQLKERAKELKCLYDIEEILQNKELELGNVFYKIIEIVPHGYQWPGICSCRIKYENGFYNLSEFVETKWFQTANIIVDNSIMGNISVYYSENLTGLEKPFLPEEQKLLNTIADRISYNLFQVKIKKTLSLLNDNINGNHKEQFDNQKDVHWKWRLEMAQLIANKTDLENFGIEAIYVIGSSKNANAGPSSDIDLMVHFDGNSNQRELFKSWINGWSLALAEYNWQKTGYKIDDGIIDLHLITDEDIQKNDSFATMINCYENSAHLLRKRK